MPMFKIIATIEVNTEAADHAEAQQIGMDCLDWSNADIQVLEDDAELEHIEGMRFMHQGQVIETFGHLVEASGDDWDAFLDELRGLTYVESKDDGYIVQEIQQ